MISTGMYLTKLLEAYGVDTVFGIPGVHTVELYRGLAGSGVRHVTPRHEQGAGFMADGYARATGKPGVCFIITGPGMTNILTAMAQAYGDSVPMLVISTVNSHGRMGSGEGWLHELPDQQALVSQVSAFSHTVNRPEELAAVVARAFAIFEGGRPRPVHIELPINVMLAAADHLPEPVRAPRLGLPTMAGSDLEAAVNLLEGASRPVILCGGGSRQAGPAIRALAERIDSPVAMTTNARGLLPPEHPLSVSISASMPATRALIAGSDVVLALGTELGPTDYDMYEDGFFGIPGKLIRIDIDPGQIMRGVLPSLGIVGDAETAALMLAGRLSEKKADGAARAQAANEAGLRELSAAMQGDIEILNRLRQALPDAVFVGDSTQLVYAGNLGFAAAGPGSWFNAATGYGTLGYGLPAAIGAKLGLPQRPVIALVGDGGLQFTIAELGSAMEARTPVVLLVFDNKGYGEIKSYMVSQNIPPLGVDLYTPDLASVGRAFGWNVESVNSLDGLINAAGTASSGVLPTMIVFGQAVRDEATTVASV
ncbi:MAG: hypothetical protein RLZZ444_2579 [Pseudomonadota bacterium]